MHGRRSAKRSTRRTAKRSADRSAFALVTGGGTAGVAKLLGILVVPAAVITTGLVVAASSYSAFSYDSSSATNNWSTGNVLLSNDSSGTALFNLSNLKPGLSTVQCITVTSTGSLPSTVKLFTTGVTNLTGLAANLTMTVVQGTGGSFGSCTGFTPLATGSSLFNGTLQALASSSSFATGVGTWAPTGTATESRTFQITSTVSSLIPNSLQSATTAVGFTWEAQNS